jgi:hypothetical protein
MLNRVFFIKMVHTVIFLYMSVCLLYILYAGITRAFGLILVVAICSILVEGVVLLLNRGRCPFTVLAEKHGAKSGSVTDIFLPDYIARNTFRFSTVLFALEMVLLAVRYFIKI